MRPGCLRRSRRRRNCRSRPAHSSSTQPCLLLWPRPGFPQPWKAPTTHCRGNSTEQATASSLAHESPKCRPGHPPVPCSSCPASRLLLLRLLLSTVTRTSSPTLVERALSLPLGADPISKTLRSKTTAQGARSPSSTTSTKRFPSCFFPNHRPSCRVAWLPIRPSLAPS